MSETGDELRIVAADARGLDHADRALIARAADELDIALEMVVKAQSAIIDAQRRQIAANERLFEMRRDEAERAERQKAGEEQAQRALLLSRGPIPLKVMP